MTVIHITDFDEEYSDVGSHLPKYEPHLAFVSGHNTFLDARGDFNWMFTNWQKLPS